MEGQVFNRAGRRTLLALAFAVSSLVVIGIAPVSAEVDYGCVGKCGEYQVYDSTTMPGAKCTYGTSYPYKLREISVRPPIMHGWYSYKTPVLWRFRIQRQPVGGGSWTNLFTSGYQSSTASNSIAAYANHGFSRRTWDAPNNVSGYRYRVMLNLQWKKSGSVEGTARVLYQVYNRVSGMNSDKAMDYCIQSY